VIVKFRRQPHRIVTMGLMVVTAKGEVVTAHIVHATGSAAAG
jgi:hypothetical protein